METLARHNSLVRTQLQGVGQNPNLSPLRLARYPRAVQHPMTPLRLRLVDERGAVDERDDKELASLAALYGDGFTRLLGLTYLDLLRDDLDRSRRRRRGHLRAVARTAKEEHLQETGHELSFGCCRPSDAP